MLGDVQAEALLFHPQQLGLLELVIGNRRMVTRRGGGRVAEIEDRRLAEQPVLLLLLAVRERVLEHVKHPATRRSTRARRSRPTTRGSACSQPPGRRAR